MHLVRTRRRRGRLAIGALALAVVSSVGVPAPATASAYQRGPDPTAAALQTTGPFAYTSFTVPDSATPGFGAATIYHPTSTAEGTFGGVAVVPGYTATQSSISWYGPRFASHGFVVITIDTNSRYDQPAARATQLLAALDYLTNTSAAKGRVDPTRLAVAGHSMGGGGSIEATKTRPSLQASVPLTPWHTDKTWPEVTVPTMIVGADGDTVAPVSSHAEPIYTSMTAAPEKAYLELNNATHSAPTSGPNATISLYAISWLKRWVDDDLRYDQFLCPPPAPSTLIDEYRATCPH